jgi:hypothetical protein
MRLGKVPIGRPRRRRKDNIKMDVKKTGYEGERAHGTSSGSCPIALSFEF